MVQLDVGRCDELTDASFLRIAKTATHLTHINLEWCFHVTDNGAGALLRRCPQLRFVKLEGCKLVSDLLLEQAMEEREGDEGFLRELRMLNLVYINSITDEAISAFSLRFPQVSVANYYGDIVQKGETTDNPGTDTGGWDDGDTEQQIFFGDSEMDGFG